MIEIKLPNNMQKTSTLPFCGTNPNGDTIEVNSKYITKNSEPWLCVMGEFHFSRYPSNEWEKEILKMQAGGVNVIATYVFWIHHEEERGVFNFEGNCDLRRFVGICNKHNIMVMLRIGPWAHGECRNGGFPDWLQNQTDFAIRQNDAAYLEHVHRLYAQIYMQVQGMLFTDGGCVVGIQIENEYGPCGVSPAPEIRMEHMKKLKKMAVEIGFKVPIYTATGWGGATVVDMEMLPVMGGYCDAPWAQTTEEMPESINFLVRHALNDPTIGCDHNTTDESGRPFTWNVGAYPFLTAELGGGMQVTDHRRVVVFPKDTLALAVTKLCSGAVLLGYYMYHGGTNPLGKYSTFEESRVTGYPNDLPKMSYDFQAPLGEVGLPNDSYFELKRLHMMLHCFGHLIADSPAIIPDNNATDPADLVSMRYAVRHNARHNCGFVMINNHLRKRTMAQHTVSFHLQNENLDLKIKDIQIKNDDVLILPYNLPLDDAILESTNATPLTRIGKRYFFFCDSLAVYNFSKGTADIITLTQEQANHAFLFGDSLYLCEQVMYQNKDKIFVESTSPVVNIIKYNEAGEPVTTTHRVSTRAASASFTALQGDSYQIEIEYNGVYEDCLLTLDYIGDKVSVFTDKLIGDWFTTGLPYHISLARHSYPKTLTVKIERYEDKAQYFDIDCPKGCSLNNVSMTPLYTIEI